MFIRKFGISQDTENLYRVFVTVKEKVNSILIKYDDVDYLECPFVNIRAIALENGITEIKPVSPEEIYFEHAVLDDTDKNRVIIKVNDTDSEEEQRFSVAHELEHFLKKKADMFKKGGVLKLFGQEKKNNALKKAGTIKEYRKNNDLAARTGKNYKKAISIVKTVHGSRFLARYISKTVSTYLGIKVSKEKAYIELAKALVLPNDYLERKNTSFLVRIINKLYDEEIADYFAANLLVPTERFIFWKDKPDEEIAEKFKVSEACIKKRRKEIKHELIFSKSRKYLSNDKA
jgi:hypothetical protein